MPLTRSLEKSRPEAGFGLAEMLVSMAISIFILLGVLAAYSQATSLKLSVQSRSTIQANLRAGMDLLEQELRMIGFGVPTGAQVSSTTLWTPVIFYANATSIGFRAEIDSGNAEITCTPKSTSVGCPNTRLRVGQMRYYSGLNCKKPDNAAADLPLVVVLDGGAWQPTTCTALDVANSYLTVGAVNTGTFTAGISQAYTIEQVYYRYVAATAPPYGYIERYVRYENTPSSTFPPTGVTWTRLAEHLTAFQFQYLDASGTALAGNPLSTAQANAVDRIRIVMQGYDSREPFGREHTVDARAEVLLRN